MATCPAASAVIFLRIITAFVVTSTAWAGYEDTKRTASDGAAGDYFGHSVAVDNDIAVVGAYWYDHLGRGDAGAAYVFYRDSGGTDNWGEVARLNASDYFTEDHFGVSVSISGDIIVVGANQNDDYGRDSGSVYIFYRNWPTQDAWGERLKLMPSNGEAGDFFGADVSLSGDVLVVGADGHDSASDYGSAYIFYRNEGGADAWGEVKETPAHNPGDYFGNAVSVNGDTVVVGAVEDDTRGTNAGAAFVYQRDWGGADNWGEVAKLIASDGQPYDYFSEHAVSICGDTIVIGAPQEDEMGSNAGAIYIYERNWSGPDSWGEVAKRTANDGEAGAGLGAQVSVSGDAIVAGARWDDNAGGIDAGAAYVFYRNWHAPDNWGPAAKLIASDAETGDQLGRSVSVNGDTIWGGAWHEDQNGVDSGSAYVFSLPASATGDLNCDGLINNGDIDPFVLAVTDTAAYIAAYPDCDPYLADCNFDGWVNNADIDPFVASLAG